MTTPSKPPLSSNHRDGTNTNFLINASSPSSETWRPLQGAHQRSCSKSTLNDARAFRISEIEFCIKNDISGTAGPFLIPHHICAGLAIAESFLREWEFNTQPSMLGNVNLYDFATKWVDRLDNRIVPAMHGASMTINPEENYFPKYQYIAGQYLHECSEIAKASEKAGKQNKSAAALQRERAEYAAAIQAFVEQLREWTLQALHDLSRHAADAKIAS